MTTFPLTNGYDLKGTKYTLPIHLEGNLNLLLITWADTPQTLLDSWQPAVQQLGQQHNRLHYYELPILESQSGLETWVLSGIRRAGIYNQRVRHAPITIALPAGQQPPVLALPAPGSLSLMLLDKQGTIIWQQAGAAASGKISQLTQAVVTSDSTAARRHETHIPNKQHHEISTSYRI